MHISFRVLNVPEDEIECDSFTVISFNSLLVYENKYYLQVYQNNCAYKILDKRIIDYLSENLFEADQSYFLINWSYKCCISIGFI